MSKNTIISALQKQLSAVAGSGQVNDRPGGVQKWASTPGEKRAFFEIDLCPNQPVVERNMGPGPQNFARYQLQIDGWMPFSFQNPNSSAVWRDLTDAVRTSLRVNKTLGLAGAISGIGEPAEVRGGYQVIDPSGTQPDQRTTAPAVECHYCRFEIWVEEKVVYQPQ